MVDQHQFSMVAALRAFFDGGYPVKLGAPASLCYMLLLRRADSHGECYPGQRGIARDLGVGARSVCRGIAALERAGIIQVIDEHGQVHSAEERRRTGQWNRYRLLPIWRSDATVASPNATQALPQRHTGVTGDATVASKVDQVSNTGKVPASPATPPLAMWKSEGRKLWRWLMQCAEAGVRELGAAESSLPKLMLDTLRARGGFKRLMLAIRDEGTTVTKLSFMEKDLIDTYIEIAGAARQEEFDAKDRPAPVGENTASNEATKVEGSNTRPKVAEPAVDEAGQETMAPSGTPGESRGEVLI